MFNKDHKSMVVRIALVLVLITGVFGMTPVQASAETINATVSNSGFLEGDGTLKLDGSALASFRANNWDVQLDPVRGSIFSPKDLEAFSPLASTITVTNTNDSGVGSLRQAIVGAVSGDTITFAASLAGQTITLASDLSITKSLTIDGSDLSPQITISGGNIAHLEIGLMSTVTLSDLTIANGYSGSSGGAISSSGNLTIIDSTLKNNYSGSSGGAISSGAGLLVVRNTTIYQNQATSAGGAIVINGGQINNIIVNSTVTLNQAGSFGGAIFMNGSAGLTIFNSTFARNDSPNGSELTLMGLTDVFTYNTIFVCLSDVNLCYTHTGSPNLTLTNSVMNTGNLADFGLMDLADNGGSTLTMALSSNSSLIDVGDDTTCSNSPVSNLDQRGGARPRGSHCDIGAYEYDQILYVKQGATGSNNGSSWVNAYTDLQSALSAASSGDEIWVAAGTYKPTTGTDRTIFFILKNGVAIYGGFAGTETLRTQRNPSTNVTILSGEIGAVGNTDNSYHVVLGNGTNASAVLDGFTITAGNADDLDIDNGGGGGMFIKAGNPTLTNLIVSENTALNGGGAFFESSSPAMTHVTFNGNSAVLGGGMYNYLNSAPTITDATFNGNSISSGGSGGGMYNHNSSPNLTNLTFNSNTMAVSGGGMYNHNGSPNLTNVTFSSNSAYRGGGMSSDGNSNPTLINVTFISNTAVHSGGGIANDNNSSTLINVTFNDNTAGYDGGGMYNTSSNPTLTNVTFNNNIANLDGGGMYNSGSSPTLTNVTLSGNLAQEYGGGMYNGGGSPTLINVSFSDNSADLIGGGMDNHSSNLTLTNVIIANSSSGGDCVKDIWSTLNAVSANNLIEDAVNACGLTNGVNRNIIGLDPNLGPLANNGGFTQTMALGVGSPAINAGTNTGCPATDQRGVARPQGSQCDIGAYEFMSTPSGALTNWNNTFSWTGVSGATWYLVQVQATDDTVILQKWYTADSVGCSGDLSCIVSPVETLSLANGDYKWRTLDYGDYGYGSWTPYTNFSLNAACYTLATNVLPIESGTINISSQNCSDGYIAGTVVQLSAVPNSGYAFASWSGNVSGTSNPVSVTMDANKNVTANLLSLGATLIAPVGEQTSWSNAFSWTGIAGASWYLVQAQTNDDTVILQKWYTADAAGCSGDLSCSVSPAETLSLANGDYHWRILDYGDYGYGSWTPYTNFNLNAACYTLTMDVLPIGSGAINTSTQNCSGGYMSGTVVQLTALPNSGYTFASWSGNAAGTSNPVLITMDAHKSVTANLTALGATLIAPVGEQTSWNNSFTWAGVNEATWYLVQAQTNDDTVILQKWYTADAAGCFGDLSCVVLPDETLNLANGDYKWRILDYGDYGYGSWTPYTNFSLNAVCYTLTTNVLPSGSGMVTTSEQNCSGGYLSGTMVQMTALSNSGYVFASWSGNAAGTSNPVSIIMDANKNVTANMMSLGTTLIAPSSALTSWDNTFSWIGITGATWYLVQVQAADDTVILQQWYTADAAGCAGDLSCAVSPAETLTLANSDYKWRILDYGDYGYGSWSLYTTFSLNQ